MLKEQSDKEDLSLRVDDILVSDGILRFTTAMTYTARNDTTTGFSFQTIDVPGHGLVLLPFSFSEVEFNEQVIVPSIGVRYGASSKLQFSATTSWIASQTKSFNSQNGSSEQSNSRFSGVSLGMSYLLREDNSLGPAVVLDYNISAIENNGSDKNSYSYGKTNQLGLTLYKVVDPAILTTNFGYNHSGSREISGTSYSSNTSLSFSPSISLALNDRITTSTGVSFQSISSLGVNNIEVAPARTNAQFNFGMGYSLDEGQNIQVYS
ncbi:MAG: hypothetical protein RL596_1712, partial [Bacteroidota bacterium]